MTQKKSLLPHINIHIHIGDGKSSSAPSTAVHVNELVHNGHPLPHVELKEPDDGKPVESFASDVAMITVKLPKVRAPDLLHAFKTNHLFETPDEQMQAAYMRHTLHQTMDDMLNQTFGRAFAPDYPVPERSAGAGAMAKNSVPERSRLRNADQALSKWRSDGEKNDSHHNDTLHAIYKTVHQAMVEILRGISLLRIPPDDLFHLQDALRDHAVMASGHTDASGKLCTNTLKRHILKDPRVQKFREKHDPRHAHSSNMDYHPDTGMPSRTVLAATCHSHGRSHAHGTFLGFDLPSIHWH